MLWRWYKKLLGWRKKHPQNSLYTSLFFVEREEKYRRDVHYESPTSIQPNLETFYLVFIICSYYELHFKPYLIR